MKKLGMTLHEPRKAYQGYTLISPMEGTTTYLLDMDGRIVHQWLLRYRPGDYGYLLGNGNLLIAGRTNKGPVTIGGRSGIIMEYDWDGNLVWEYEDPTLHHDFCRMPNGNTMVLGWELVPPEIQSKVQGGVPNSEPPGGLWCDYFREVSQEGNTIWEWHAYQHLDPEMDSICPLHRRDEWTHSNTCSVLPDGDILTSWRLLDQVAIVDKTTGAFKWKWGREELGHQHDPNLLENGNILIFDNGWHTLTAPSPGSRIIEVNPKTDRIEWEYKTQPPWDFFSSFISGAQRLPNGNTLICEGMTGRVFEVTYAGEKVWEYLNPFYGADERFGNVNRLFRAYRYSPDFPGFKNKHLEPIQHNWLSHLYT